MSQDLLLRGPGFSPDLQGYLYGLGSKPWCWGRIDCTLFAANWIREATGLDPAEDFRGRYSSQAQAHRLILRAGGLVPLVSPSMARLGFARTQDPQDGDVAVVTAPVAIDSKVVLRAVSAIRLGPWWVARGEAGLVGQDFPVLAAWQLWGSK